MSKLNNLFHGKSLEEVLAERHAARDALIADATTEQQRRRIQQDYDMNDRIFVRIFNGETPPPGFRITRVTMTQPGTGKKFTFWTPDQSV